MEGSGLARHLVRRETYMAAGAAAQAPYLHPVGHPYMAAAAAVPRVARASTEGRVVRVLASMGLFQVVVAGLGQLPLVVAVPEPQAKSVSLYFKELEPKLTNARAL